MPPLEQCPDADYAAAWQAVLKQFAELLRLLRTRMGWSDIQLRAWIGQASGLDGWRNGMDPKPDAPIVTFANLTSDQLTRLRRQKLLALVNTSATQFATDRR